MLASVRARRFTGSSGKTSLDLSKIFFKDRLLGLRKMTVLLYEVTAGEMLILKAIGDMGRKGSGLRDYIYSSSSKAYLTILLLETCTSPFYVLNHTMYLTLAVAVL